jgi:hypothetical protein
MAAVDEVIRSISDISVPRPTRMSTHQYYYHINQERLKPAATLVAHKFPQKERMTAFWRYVSGSFANEADEYQSRMEKDNEAYYQMLLGAWKQRKEWDGSLAAQNKYNFLRLW